MNVNVNLRQLLSLRYHDKHLLEIVVISSSSIETTGESWNGNRTLCKGEMVDEGTLNMKTNYNTPSKSVLCNCAVEEEWQNNQRFFGWVVKSAKVNVRKWFIFKKICSHQHVKYKHNIFYIPYVS